MPILLVAILTFCFTDSSQATSNPKNNTTNSSKAINSKKIRKPSQSLDVTARWQIISNDGQNFSLNSHILDGEKEVFSLSFFRGERELKLLPAEKGIWLKWRSQVTYLMSLSLDGKKCSHPLVFIIEKPIGSKKEKSVCLSESGSEYQEKLKSLILEFNRYLYGS